MGRFTHGAAMLQVGRVDATNAHFSHVTSPGQLGIGDKEIRIKPTRVPFFTGAERQVTLLGSLSF